MSVGNDILTAMPPGVLGGLCEFGRFPENIFIIALEDGKYAANNATTDGEASNGLACFRHQQDAEAYVALPEGKAMCGEIVARSFNECRDIAKEREELNRLLLFSDGKIVEVHWIE